MDTPQPTPSPTSPSARSSKIVGALVGAVAALSIGGVGMAFAQDAVETPTTEAPAAEMPATPAPTDEDCPEKGDSGGSDAADAGAGTDV